MADRSILFSAPMVRAILAGTKTQTRRVLNPQPGWVRDGVMYWRGTATMIGAHRLRYSVGDRLWVREAWRVSTMLDAVPPRDMDRCTMPEYLADSESLYKGRIRASMHLPRWASRITLTVTDVRVQRLQDISEADAIAEGIEDVTHEVAPRDRSLRFWRRYRDGGWNGYVDTAVGSYASLWTEINGLGAWEQNPWVAAYTFTVEPRNIDALTAEAARCAS